VRRRRPRSLAACSTNSANSYSQPSGTVLVVRVAPLS